MSDELLDDINLRLAQLNLANKPPVIVIKSLLDLLDKADTDILILSNKLKEREMIK